MKVESGQDRTVVREMAARLDCFLEEDFRELASATASTVEAWRKRGTGPAYIRVGNRVLYPRAAVAVFLESKTRERQPVGRALL